MKNEGVEVPPCHSKSPCVQAGLGKEEEGSRVRSRVRRDGGHCIYEAGIVPGSPRLTVLSNRKFLFFFFFFLRVIGVTLEDGGWG